MNIEIAKPAKMSQSGSSLLRLIQNNNMPVLDLLVRESIQNSLDAYKYEKDYVKIEFLTGEFIAENLNRHLEGVQEILNSRFNNRINKYIAVRDENTWGLTGKMRLDEFEDNSKGNLFKLVYDICNPQDSPGAGGSWGLGKTVYFRIGIGIVLYYSRIINENGEFESRLAASLVEDEKNEKSIIPKIQGRAKRGIAWWGKAISADETEPITDEKEIEGILNVFGINEYKEMETGTTIIIPYINEDELLASNKTTYKNLDDKEFTPFWNISIEDFIKISVQRWYAPRLNNPKYKYGKWLKVLINDNGIGLDDMEPVFEVVQGLYNRAADKCFKSNDILDNYSVICKSINIRNVLGMQEAGNIVFTKITRENLKMLPPFNKMNPYIYINEEKSKFDTNRPIILFARKPGMVVSYEVTGSWTDSIAGTEKDEFIIGVFVLNSANTVIGMGEEFSLEEYVRKSEMADHTSWNDWGNNYANPRIIGKIQGHVKNAITKSYLEIEESDGNRLNSGLGKLLGDMLLPPESFGKKPSTGKGNNNNGKTIVKGKGVSLNIDKHNIKFTSEGVNIGFKIKCSTKINKLCLDIYIASENGKISVDEWESTLKQELPFKVIKVDLTNSQMPHGISINNEKKEDYIGKSKVEFLYSKQNIPYGICISSDEKISYELEGTLVIKAVEKSIKPVLNIYTDGGEN